MSVHLARAGLAGALLSLLALCRPAAAAPPVHPNAERYRERPGQRATGAAGAATLAARLLVSRDGSSELEATTGALDAPARAPGDLAKATLRVLADRRGIAWTRTFQGLAAGGHLGVPLAGVTPRQRFELQALVRGIDGARTDVVEVSGVALRRPDLAVDGVDAPAWALAGAPVVFSAAISERNGDVGATADCVLRVEGEEVDRARRVWLDAGGSASCVLLHAFPRPGTFRATIALERAAPRDDDPSDDEAGVAVEIRAPRSVAMASSASALATTLESTSSASSFARALDGAWTLESSQERGTRGWAQSARLDAVAAARIEFPLRRLAAVQRTAGGWSAESAFEGVEPDARWDGGACAWRRDDAAATSVYACTDSATGLATAAVQREAGEAVYWGRNHYRFWSGAAVEQADDAWSRGSGGGAPVPYGDEYRLSLAIDDAAGSLAAEAVVPLRRRTIDLDSPERCTSATWGDAEHLTCSSSSSHRETWSGHAASE